MEYFDDDDLMASPPGVAATSAVPADGAAATVAKNPQQRSETVSSRLPPALAEAMKGLASFKDLTKPTPFDGREASWPDWRVKLLSICGLLGIRDNMQYAARANMDQVQDGKRRAAECSATFWHVWRKAELFCWCAASQRAQASPHGAHLLMSMSWT